MKTKICGIFFCLTIITLFITLFASNAKANPEIKDIHGGYGVTATLINGSGGRWWIRITGTFVVGQFDSQGDILSDYQTIRTPILPPPFGIGKINITIYLTMGPGNQFIEGRTAFLLGPFVFSIK